MLKIICDHCEAVLKEEAVTVTLVNRYGALVFIQHACQRDILYVVTTALTKATEDFYIPNDYAGAALHVQWGRPTVIPPSIEE